MSVYPPSDDQGRQPAAPSFASLAQLADYLEDQADELTALAEKGLSDPRLVAELATRFAAMARERGLHFIAERFDRFIQRDATGTHGG